MLLLFPLMDMQSCIPFQIWGLEGWEGGREGTHVAAGHGPVFDDDVFGVPGVGSIGVYGAPLRGGCGVHVEVGHGDVLGVGDEGVPL